jgi:hypothetical protein
MKEDEIGREYSSMHEMQEKFLQKVEGNRPVGRLFISGKLF